jgi:branched-chain amino acid transport system ATP-binding protein
MDPILVTRNLSKSFGGLKALQDLSISVGPGEIMGLIGPNGAGKTTTINLLTGLYRPETGEILLSGRDINGSGSAEIARAGMARTFQNLRLFGNRSVRDNIRAGQHLLVKSWWSRISAIPTAEERALGCEVDVLLERFQLHNLRNRTAAELSYGEKKRLEMARALAARPRVLLLDEPAAGMNPSELDWLANTIRAIRDEGVAILLVEHHMKLVMAVCDRITVLNFGTMIAQDRPSAIARNSQVIEAYLGKESLAC